MKLSSLIDFRNIQLSSQQNYLNYAYSIWMETQQVIFEDGYSKLDIIIPFCSCP